MSRWLSGAAVAAASCSSDADDPLPARVGTSNAATPGAPPTSVTRAKGGSATSGAVPIGGHQPVTIAFAGDVHFAGQLASRLADPRQTSRMHEYHHRSVADNHQRRKGHTPVDVNPNPHR